MDAALVSALIQLGPAAYQAFTGAKQLREGKEMQQNLGPRVNYEIPGAGKQALGVMQSLASSREMSGQRNLENRLDLLQAGMLGNVAQSGSMSSQDRMAALTSFGNERMSQEQDISRTAAQDYERRQQGLYGALNTMSGYQEKVIADKQNQYGIDAEAAAQMMGGGMQNISGALQGLSTAALSGLMMDKNAKAQTQFDRQAYSDMVDESQSLLSGFLKRTGPLGGMNAPRGDIGAASPSMPGAGSVTGVGAAAGNVFTPSIGFGSRRGKDPGAWDIGEPFRPKYGGWDYKGNDMSTWQQEIFNTIH